MPPKKESKKVVKVVKVAKVEMETESENTSIEEEGKEVYKPFISLFYLKPL